jgi:hypothetical protein
MDKTFSTPILFLVFNRPDVTAQVFEKIRAMKPRYLYVVADGPRKNKDEDEKCTEVRKIVSNIDWACEPKFLFRTENFGCGKSVSTGITWFFDHVEQGIILEDDCLPELGFFTFCESLLEYHKNNAEIMHIGGFNLQNGIERGDGSYYYSSWIHVWGWATWRRAWNHYEYNVKGTDIIPLISVLRKEYNLTWKEIFFWWRNFARLKDINTWDYQWIYSVWKNKGFAIIPQQNQVKNIGITEGGTHSTTLSFDYKTIPIIEGIQHPQKIRICREADSFTFDYYMQSLKPLWKRVARKVYSKLHH